MSAPPQPQPATSATYAIFASAADKFKNSLSDKEKAEFQTTTLHSLQIAIDRIQKKQASEERLQGLRRLGAFLEGMKEYDKVISVFLNTTPFMAFVWVRPKKSAVYTCTKILN
jgi:phenylalanine-4-hydroxylase